MIGQRTFVEVARLHISRDGLMERRFFRDNGGCEKFRNEHQPALPESAQVARTQALSSAKSKARCAYPVRYEMGAKRSPRKRPIHEHQKSAVSGRLPSERPHGPTTTENDRRWQTVRAADSCTLSTRTHKNVWERAAPRAGSWPDRAFAEPGWGE